MTRPALMFAAALALAVGAPPPAPALADGPGAADSVLGFGSAAELLDALERADDEIDTFRARIVYDRLFELQGDRHVRFGSLYFRVDADPRAEGGRPVRTFGVHFDTLVLDGAMREDRQAWIFDGEWVVEKRFAQKQYVARQLARPGQGLDPLRLGEGPLPLPIGQEREDILTRYEVELVGPSHGFGADDEAAAPYLETVAHCAQLVLTPRPAFAERDRFRSIRLWYERTPEGVLLPRLSRTVDRSGDVSFVQLTDVRVNEPLPEGVTALARPDDPEWDVQIERGRFAEGAGDEEAR